MKYVNLCYVYDTGELFVDVNKITNDLKLNKEGFEDENGGEWFFGDIIERMIKGDNEFGGEISESEVEKDIKESMFDDGGDDCGNWDEMLNKFWDEVKNLGKGGKWYSWGVEYDRNILYVVEG